MANFKCIICKNTTYHLVNTGVRDSNRHNIVKCSRCEHTQLFPLPTSEEDKEFYDNDQQSQNVNNGIDLEQIKDKSMADVFRRDKMLEGILTKEKRIMEIGTGYGFFMEYLEQKGYLIEGIEVSDSRRNIAKKICQNNIYALDIVSSR